MRCGLKWAFCLRTICFDLFDYGNLAWPKCFPPLVLSLSATPVSPPLLPFIHSRSEPSCSLLFTLPCSQSKCRGEGQMPQGFSFSLRGSCSFFTLRLPSPDPCSPSSLHPPPLQVPAGLRVRRSGSHPVSLTQRLYGCVALEASHSASVGMVSSLIPEAKRPVCIEGSMLSSPVYRGSEVKSFP